MKKKTLPSSTFREKLISAIVEFTGAELDEFTHDDFIALAKESEDQLLDRLIHITEWYVDEYNND